METCLVVELEVQVSALVTKHTAIYQMVCNTSIVPATLHTAVVIRCLSMMQAIGHAAKGFINVTDLVSSNCSPSYHWDPGLLASQVLIATQKTSL